MQSESDNSHHRRPGRPLVALRKNPMTRVHLNIGNEILEALNTYAESIGERSMSVVTRLLLREKLAELGFIKPRTSFDPEKTH